ncbi:vacuolar protein sorting-associated protein 37A-like [Haliotis cracherodii]|uniref:vacuolar protein sorting-associated protein 37A-like n=1 Tax=Haliotis cracherodii TaxID=6455 RepID=UPI0039EC59C2
MMNRLFGGKGKSPQATNLQTQRTKQIESMKKTNLSVIEIVRDVEYRATISNISGTNINLIITLSPQFPQDKPSVTVQPPLTHPWVDIQMKVVGCPNINNFSMHSDLGVAIQTIVEEFKKTPPRILPHLVGQQFGAPQPPVAPVSGPGYPLYGNPQALYPPVGPPPLPPRAVENGREGPPILSDQDTNASSPAYPVPDIMKAYPELKEKGLFELQELVDNEEKVLDLLQGLPELARFTQDREDISAQCVQLARENLTKQPVVEELKDSVLKKMSELDAIKGEFETHCEHHLTLSDQFHPANIQTNLKVAVMEAEEESEKIADDFLDKKIDIEEFLQTYMQKRTLCHMRKAKEEKLNQIIMASGGPGSQY